VTDLEREWEVFQRVAIECLGMTRESQRAAMREAFYAGMCRMFFLVKGLHERPIPPVAQEDQLDVWEAELRAEMQAIQDRPCPVHGDAHRSDRRRDIP
jgi:hypothetical protein